MHKIELLEKFFEYKKTRTRLSGTVGIDKGTIKYNEEVRDVTSIIPEGNREENKQSGPECTDRKDDFK